jgi:futalosine hydrolase
MNILLTAATAREIEPFFSYYHNTKEKLEIDILITGIGLTATTYHLSKQVFLKRPDLVIQAGIAGCFHKKISLGTVVAVKAETIADLVVIESKEIKTMFDLRLAHPNQFPFSKGWLVNNSDILNQADLKKVKAISVNEITTSRERVSLYKKKFKPVLESMEGAALHYVCLMEKIPFIQVRAVSNYMGERNKKNWKLKESILNLNHELIKLVESL